MRCAIFGGDLGRVGEVWSIRGWSGLESSAVLEPPSTLYTRRKIVEKKGRNKRSLVLDTSRALSYEEQNDGVWGWLRYGLTLCFSGTVALKVINDK